MMQEKFGMEYMDAPPIAFDTVAVRGNNGRSVMLGMKCAKLFSEEYSTLQPFVANGIGKV